MFWGSVPELKTYLCYLKHNFKRNFFFWKKPLHTSMLTSPVGASRRQRGGPPSTALPLSAPAQQKETNTKALEGEKKCRKHGAIVSQRFHPAHKHKRFTCKYVFAKQKHATGISGLLKRYNARKELASLEANKLHDITTRRSLGSACKLLLVDAKRSWSQVLMTHNYTSLNVSAYWPCLYIGVGGLWCLNINCNYSIQLYANSINWFIGSLVESCTAFVILNICLVNCCLYLPIIMLQN